MPDLLTMLRDSDEILPTLAQLWGVSINNKSPEEAIQAVHSAMLQTERAETVWDLLDDKQRGALQLLIASQRKMPTAKFERAFGKVRKMGRGQIEREKPHRHPESVAEGLFYRGFIGEAHEKAKGGLQSIMYVPDDLAQILPVHKTAYANLKDEPLPPTTVMTIEALEPIDEDDLSEIQPADTSLVDDMTTLLAYLRRQGAGVAEDAFLPIEVERLSPYLLKTGADRLAFLLGVGVSAELISVHEGQATPNRNGVQKWLSATRSEQLKALTEAWRTSKAYIDLWHVPTLHFEIEAGAPYDPQLGREAVLALLKKYALPQEWWSVDDFVELVKSQEADYQRPNGDYQSWYIQDQRGVYLRGFESWDAVDGVLIDFFVRSPLHWLGLCDISEEGARLTAYGRGFLGLGDWPQAPDPAELIEIQPDGILIASRKVPRVDRFQLARFTTWGKGGAPYHYRLDAEGIQHGLAQGITTQHIATFLKRQNHDKALPAGIQRLLETWQSGNAQQEVSFERLLVMRTSAQDVLDKCYDDPALRRYLGARLGAMACVVRVGHEDALQVALGELGIKVEWVGEK